ncbi:MAG: zinc dependent phospholipase C family protein [Candidatus Magnetominusculus sp. LBB02]|nr:zinc dependent phospholipase C family protein [Candidatus Magnetominusculus sp. LBB02]
MLLFCFLVMGFIAIPAAGYSWGPLTHIYLGNEVLSLPYLLPPAIYVIIRKFKEDFLYGNIIADIVLGKKYLPQSGNSHSWEFGFAILDSAQNAQQQAFSYGYLCHLAADTVCHEILTKERKNIEHTMYEIKADSLINKKYWLQAVAIKRSVQKRNDEFLENSISNSFFSFKVNKGIFKSLVFMSLFTSMSVINMFEKSFFMSASPPPEAIRDLTGRSLKRIVDVITNGRHSYVTKYKPAGKIVHGPIYKTLFQDDTHD